MTMVSSLASLLVLLVVSSCGAFVPTTTPTLTSTSTSIFYQNDQTEVGIAQATVATSTTTTTTTPLKKPTIYPLSSIQELYDFLVEDDRLTAVKFHAPWCKKCQRMGLHYRKLAHDKGDGVVQRKLAPGQIRCAEMEYSDVTAGSINALQIEAVPTLQLYRGTQLLWQASGRETRVQEMSARINTLLELTPNELLEYVNSLEDEGILEQAVEDSFFDNGLCTINWEEDAQCVY